MKEKAHSHRLEHSLLVGSVRETWILPWLTEDTEPFNSVNGGF